MSDIAISVQNVSKAYRIWRDPSARLKAPLWDLIGQAVPAALRPPGLRNRLEHQGNSPYYKDFYALKNISFEVKKGEAYAIIGRNGSGKSTLLQMIAGTLTPTEGRIRVKGRVAALLELGSGFNPDFTGRENVYLNASVLGLTREETDARYDEIASFADIGDFIDQPVKTYSSGMSMRLAFAVIAHVDADILIVDEALAVGDVFFVQKCMRFIRQFQEKGTLLLVTHDTGAVQSLCQKAVWLHHGECRGIGTSKKITESYLEAIYEEKQGAKLFTENEPATRHDEPIKANEPTVDQRAAYINNSNLRNDLQVFDFNPNSSGYGAGGALIEEVKLLDAKSRSALAYGIGGEDVIITITVLAKIHLDQPIIGFLLKNHLGQVVFAENTYLSYEKKPMAVRGGDKLQARFEFIMPYMPPGDYVISAAIANGTQENHIQHHWMHDAIAIRIDSSHVLHGLIGVPMRKIEILTPLNTV
jgi:lipopolysaccharide transport system ATP-binding protein